MLVNIDEYSDTKTNPDITISYYESTSMVMYLKM